MEREDMKSDRLIGILSILLQEEKTTAPVLAEKFEVSRRTINRDIEDLCKAGIPIKTAQGSGGGISIMDGYRIDRTILTSKDVFLFFLCERVFLLFADYGFLYWPGVMPYNLLKQSAKWLCELN